MRPDDQNIVPGAANVVPLARVRALRDRAVDLTQRIEAAERALDWPDEGAGEAGAGVAGAARASLGATKAGEGSGAGQGPFRELFDAAAEAEALLLRARFEGLTAAPGSARP